MQTKLQTKCKPNANQMQTKLYKMHAKSHFFAKNHSLSGCLRTYEKNEERKK